jgi:ABC-type dipeptide/oligopeptide/nickel transport system permease component
MGLRVALPLPFLFFLLSGALFLLVMIVGASLGVDITYGYLNPKVRQA